MSDNNEKKSISRRKLLKSLAASGGAVIAGKSLPESWSRPVVDSVMLPAHALTSFVGRSFTNPIRGVAIDPDSQFARVLGSLVNEAHAGNNGIPMVFERTCIRENADGTVRVDARIDNGYIDIALFSAPSVVVNSPPVPMSGSPCFGMLLPPDASLVDTLGLIPDAHAGIFEESVEVVVESINGSAIGAYLISVGDPFELPFDLPVGECSPPACPAEILL
jgi:hypothetical protein